MKSINYVGQGYFQLQTGLIIVDKATGYKKLKVYGESLNEIREVAKKVLNVLNEPYYMGMALLRDNQELFDIGLITPQEKELKDKEIHEKY